ncbi:MAG: helix-turn-helix domain-containing protein [Nannocystaceae bacterium]
MTPPKSGPDRRSAARHPRVGRSGSARGWPRARAAERRDVRVASVLVTLRSGLGLDPLRPGSGELAAERGRESPAMLSGVDTGAVLAWVRAGLALFADDRLPTSEEALTEARRVLLAVAMERTGGNITAVGSQLGLSRRAVRCHLRAQGLYDLELLT